MPRQWRPPPGEGRRAQRGQSSVPTLAGRRGWGLTKRTQAKSPHSRLLSHHMCHKATPIPLTSHTGHVTNSLS